MQLYWECQSDKDRDSSPASTIDNVRQFNIKDCKYGGDLLG